LIKLTPKSARQNAGLTQAQMADKMGICKQTYSKLENNPEFFTIRAALLFCNIVNLSIDDVNFLPCNST
jgi:DNA-binding XRE family transcriptional regulator